MSATSVLYDVPGPKARLRYRLYGLVSLVAVGGLLAYVLYKLNESGQFSARKWEIFQYTEVQKSLLRGLGATVKAGAIAGVLALALGGVLAAGRLSDHRLLRVPSYAAVELFRAVPLLILIFFMYYGFKFGQLTSVVLGLTIYNGAVLAEIFRAGINAVDRGQSEAGYALGLRKNQVMRIVLLPQAVRSMLPAIVSQLVVLLKDVALGFLITYRELLTEAKQLFSAQAFEFPVLPVTFVVAAIYIVMCSMLSLLAKYLEGRTRRTRKTAAPTVAVEAETAPTA
ncbi:MAG: polar amino acid transporter, inner rane subunit [Jatrophihabitantaceae bacterium]|nr:polar amino acid transporter, inner rane subunit [Jatrophihabitantaceae bacterium]